MPEGVPTGVADSFAALLPAGITLTITGIIFAVFHFITNSSFAEFIYKMVQTPLQGVTDSFFGVVIMAMIMSLLWWVGVHGGNICGAILAPILQSNMADNQGIIDSGKELTIANGGHIFTQQFWDNFLCMTGAGIVIGLVLFITFFAKSKQLKELGKLAFIPNLFNINEPIIFGVPIVMNLYLLLPFVLVPVLVGASSYLLMSLGILPLFTGVMVPWTTPPIISGFLIGGWRIALWQFVIIVASVAIYYPFIKKVDQTLQKNEQTVLDEETLTSKTESLMG
jgi:PTS system cellobiose-specific IIC component